MSSLREIDKESFLPSRAGQCRNVMEFGSIDQPRARTRVFGPSPTMHLPPDEIGWIAPWKDTYSLTQTSVTFLERQHQKCCQELRLATMSLDLQLVMGIRATLQKLD